MQLKQGVDNSRNICRPICLFTLKDKVVLSLTNRYLTRLFDPYFEESAYAFRAKRNGENKILSHHDCVKALVNYRERNKGFPLSVVECDIEKFYDSVNHQDIKRLFNNLIGRSKLDFPLLDFQGVSHVFFEYLDCYSFNLDVLPRADEKYWRSFNIVNGEFEWVRDKMLKLGYYTDLNSERIGVPQGGALSGLIANIVLDVADKRVQKEGVFYIRYCDDMVLIDSDPSRSEKAKKQYLQALNELKLVSHEFSESLSTRSVTKKQKFEFTLSTFWERKSKGPYLWDAIENSGNPWIGFVGYEINHQGNIRVRKKSFQKELVKQEQVINNIREAIKTGMRKSKKSVAESAIHRLVGMSVGRVTMRNFGTVDNGLCWKNGFKLLKMNRYVVQQLKHLDRNRNRLYSRLIKDLSSASIELDIAEPNRRQIIHFNKPFSYYYQILERNDSQKG